MARVAADTLIRARALRRRLTNAETILWSRLRHGIGGIRFRRQHPIGRYIADFACIRARLVVEVDGATHSSDAERRHDARRDAFLRSRSRQIIRVGNIEVYRSLDAVLEWIINTAGCAAKAPSTASRSPSPTRSARWRKRSAEDSDSQVESHPCFGYRVS